jgi:hypothetical protein
MVGKVKHRIDARKFIHLSSGIEHRNFKTPKQLDFYGGVSVFGLPSKKLILYKL